MDVLQNDWPVLFNSLSVIVADALMPPDTCPQHSVIVLAGGRRNYRNPAGGSLEASQVAQW